MKQFVIRYGNYKMSEIEKREIPENEKFDALRKVADAVRYCELGMVTIDETTKTIAEA